MKRSILLVCFLAGCAPAKMAVFSRFDGAPLAPAAKEQAITECHAKAQVASAQVPSVGYGSVAELSRSIEQMSVKDNFVKGCLAEKGIKVEWVEGA